MAVTKKVRFEVFKRDSFTCQYCGRSAPTVILNLDHIMPRAKGGVDDILNLVTSCYDCNQGKKDRELSDDAVLQKRKAQLDSLQERREQLEMMMEWQRGLDNLETEALTQLADYWIDLARYSLNEAGLRSLQKLTRRFSIPEITAAMKIAVDQYAHYDSDGDPAHDSIVTSWEKVGAICGFNKRCKEKPYLRDLYYARGILRNRLSYINEHQAIPIMEAAIMRGVLLDDIRECALSAYSWSNFNSRLEDAAMEARQEVTPDGPNSVN